MANSEERGRGGPAAGFRAGGARPALLAVAVLAVAFVLAALPPAARAATGPIAAFNFDVDGGGTIADVSGNGNNGQCVPGSTCPAFAASGGHTGGGYNFAGAGNYIELTNEAPFDFTTNFTVNLWMKASTLGNTWAQLIGKGDSAWAIERQSSSSTLSFTTFSPLSQNLVGTRNVQDNQWHHVAIVYDGTRKVLYIDGQVDAQTTFTRPVSTNNVKVRLGFNTEYPTGQYDGLLDDLRIYDRTLSQAEVQSDMNTPVGGTAPPPPPPPPPAQGFVNEIVLTGLNLPTTLQPTPDGRMLIGELGGRIDVWQPGAAAVNPTPMLQLTNIGTLASQQGLIDIVLDPGFSQNGYYYVFYTAGSPNRDRVSRFTAQGDLTVPGSEVVIWQDDRNAEIEHHGGALMIDNSGMLFITTGEHFQASLSQRLDTYRGKVLRLFRDGTVPTDNPFYDGAGPNFDAIWALGLRNPYRASYDAPTGRMFIGDVGGNDPATAYEEVNLGRAGANYGWPNCEGPCPGTAFEPPIHSYPHAGRDAAITGGFVYRGTQYPAEYRGSYFYADYVQSWIRRLTFNPVTGAVAESLPFFPADGSADGPWGDIVDLTQGPDGAIYYLDLGFDDQSGTYTVGKVRRIRYVSGNQPPAAVAAANPTGGPAPLTVQFSSANSGDPEGQPISFQWDFGDGTTSTEASPQHVYTTSGSFRATLAVSDGASTTNATPITIQVGSPPQVAFGAPVDGSHFRAGDSIVWNATASDPDEGRLPASALTCSVNFLHDTHVHPGVPFSGIDSGTVQIPVTGHDFSGNTRYEFRCTATDRDGLQGTAVVTIFPEKVNLSFATTPAGLVLSIDGVQKTSPFTLDTLIGFQHTIAAADQSSGGSPYRFVSWSDGGAVSHSITVPTQDASYTAGFEPAPVTGRPGQIAAFNFDGVSNGRVVDRSGRGNDALCTPGSTCPAFPTAGGHTLGAGDFAGAGNYLELANESPFDFTSALSVCLWMKASNLGNSWAQLIGKGDSAWAIERQGTTNRLSFTTFAPTSDNLVSTTSVADNRWHHVAVVYDGAFKRLYLDGRLEASRAYTRVLRTNNVKVRLGYNTEYPTGQYSGLLDDVRVYDRALSQTEVQGDMATPVP